MRFERIVVVGRRRIGAVERDSRSRECNLDIAADRVGLVAGIDLLRLVQISTICTQLDVMRLLLITDNDQVRSLARNLQGLGDDDGNELTVVRDGIGLEHCLFSSTWRCKTRRILVR